MFAQAPEDRNGGKPRECATKFMIGMSEPSQDKTSTACSRQAVSPRGAARRETQSGEAIGNKTSQLACGSFLPRQATAPSATHRARRFVAPLHRFVIVRRDLVA